MSGYYKIPRGSDWNYGGKNWKLSRSKIDLFIQCPRCFYLDNKFGLKRPPGFPFSLNSAVDVLLKKEFDEYRRSKQPHPIMIKYGIEAIPFEHKDLDFWRDTLKGGVQFLHPATGFLVTGALDDIWINKNGELIVVDYKSTSKEEEIKELNKEWQDGYKRQMEVYQWLLRMNGFKVNNTGYFVYTNGKTDLSAFNNKLEFETSLVLYAGNDGWIENKLFEIKKCLDSNIIPESNIDCDECTYEKYKKQISNI